MAEKVKGAIGLRLRFIKSLLWRPSKWFVVVGIFGVLGIYDLVVDQFVVQGAQDSFPTAIEITRWIPWWAWASGFVAALFLVTIEGAYRKVRAAEQERNGAKAAPQAGNDSPGAMPDAPVVAPTAVHIEYEGHYFGFAGDGFFDRANLPKDVLLLRVDAMALVDGTTTVESWELRIKGERLTSLLSRPEYMHSGVGFGLNEYFAVPKHFNPGDYLAQLVALAEGKWWASKPFTVTMPQSSGHK